MLLVPVYLYAVLHSPSATNDEMRKPEPSKDNYRKSGGKLAAIQKVR